MNATLVMYCQFNREGGEFKIFALQLLEDKAYDVYQFSTSSCDQGRPSLVWLFSSFSTPFIQMNFVHVNIKGYNLHLHRTRIMLVLSKILKYLSW